MNNDHPKTTRRERATCDQLKARDPGELHNLAQEPAHESLLKEWRARMIQHPSERGEEFVSGGKLALRKKRFLYSPNYPKGS